MCFFGDVVARLTDKQRRFSEEYIVDLNATAAYKRAGYSAQGNAAEVNASRLLRNAKVAERVSAMQRERAERTQITADRVLEEYARLGFSDMRQFAEWGPDGVTWKDSEDLSEGAAACVAEVSETVSEGGRTRRFKLHSKTSALDALAKHTGIFDRESASPGVSVNVNVNVRPEEERREDYRELHAEIAAYRTGFEDARNANPGEAAGADQRHNTAPPRT